MGGDRLEPINIPIVIDDSQIKPGIAKAFDSISKQLDSASRSLKSAGRGLTLGITAPIVGAGAAVGKFATDFDAAMTKSTAIMSGLSKEMKDKMAKTAIEVSKTGTASASQLAEGYFFLASAGLDAAQSIGALPVVARFAQAGAFDLALATDLLTDAQSALGLSSKDTAENMENMTRLGNVLVKANTMANASVLQFSESLTNKGAASLRGMGKGMEEGVAVLAAFADQGRKGRIAGEALSIILAQLPTLAKKNAEEFKQFGIRIFDANGEVSHMADIVADFEKATAGMSGEQKTAFFSTLGLTEALADNLRMLIGTSDKIRTYEAGLKDSAGVMDEVANEQLTGLTAKLVRLKNIILAVPLAKMGPLVDDYVKPAVDRLTESIVKLSDRFGEMTGTQQLIGVSIAGLAAALGPLTYGFGVVLGLISSIVGVMGGPFLAVALGASVVAAYIYENWDKVSKVFADVVASFTGGTGDWKAALSGIYQSASEYLDGVISWFAKLWDTAAPYLSQVAEFFIEQFGKIMSWADEHFPNLGKAIGNVWWFISQFIDVLGPAFGTAWENLQVLIGTSISVILDVLGILINVLAGDFSGAWTDIESLIGNVVSGVIELMGNLKDGVLGVLGALLSKIKDMGSAIGNAVVAPFAWAYDTLVGHSIVPDLVKEIEANMVEMRGKTGVIARQTADAWVEAWRAGKEAVLDEQYDLAMKSAEAAAKNMPKEGRKSYLDSARDSAGLARDTGKADIDAAVNAVQAYRDMEIAHDRFLAFREDVATSLQTLKDFADLTGQSFNQTLFNEEVLDIWRQFGFDFEETLLRVIPLSASLGEEVDAAMGGVAAAATDEFTAAMERNVEAQASAAKGTRTNIAETRELSGRQQGVVFALDSVAAGLSALPGKYQKWASVAQTAANVVRIAMSTVNPVVAAVQIGIELLGAAFGLMGDKAEEELSNIDKMIQSLDDALTEFGNRFTDELVTMIREGKANWGDFVDYVIEELLRITVQYAITEPLLQGIRALYGAAFADGGVFGRGNVMAFADGGVVSGPTIFPMANGLGLMGEAGPEAVMPLKRGSDGRLGVSFDGLDGMIGSVTVNNYGSGEATVRETRGSNGARNVEVLIEETVRRGMSYGRYDDTMRGTFGIPRRPATRR